MPEWLAAIFELAKIFVPAFIVYYAVSKIFRQYLASQYNLQSLNIKEKQKKNTLPLRLGAYERLSLFCECIAIPSLVLRLRDEEMSAEELKIAMMIAIQKEYEHNITQQVYVSEQLWEIIKVTRDDVVNIIYQVAAECPKNANANKFSELLFNFLSQRGTNPLDTALSAVKKEAAQLLQ